EGLGVGEGAATDDDGVRCEPGDLAGVIDDRTGDELDVATRTRAVPRGVDLAATGVGDGEHLGARLEPSGEGTGRERVERAHSQHGDLPREREDARRDESSAQPREGGRTRADD